MTTLLFLGFCLWLYWNEDKLLPSDFRTVFIGTCLALCMDAYILICLLTGSR